MSITIKDVARHAGVCIATVSRAFNEPDRVSDKKKERIFQAAEELHYQPNALARGLITKHTNSIGVLVPDIDNIFHPGVIRGIEDYCSSHGYLSYVCNTYSSVEKEKKYIATLLKQRIDGFIFVGTRPVAAEENAHLVRLAERSNVVLMFDDLPNAKLCAVYTDEVKGAYDAVKYLNGLGHTRIALFNSDAPYTTYRYKQRGYENGLRAMGLPLRGDYIFCGSPYAAGGYSCMQQMCSRFPAEERPHAVFAVSDQVALGVLRYCREHGIRVPEDLAIVGYSGTKMVEEFGEAFPTIDQHPYQIGQMAAKILIARADQAEDMPRTVVMENQLKLPQKPAAQ